MAPIAPVWDSRLLVEEITAAVLSGIGCHVSLYDFALPNVTM